MSVGVLAHLFGKQTYDKLAENVSHYGFRHFQLALWKAFSYPDFGSPGLLSPGLARQIREVFQKYNISISSVSSPCSRLLVLEKPHFFAHANTKKHKEVYTGRNFK